MYKISIALFPGFVFVLDFSVNSNVVASFGSSVKS